LVVVDVVRLFAVCELEVGQLLVVAHSSAIACRGSLFALHRQHEPYYVVLTDATVAMVTEHRRVVPDTEQQQQQ